MKDLHDQTQGQGYAQSRVSIFMQQVYLWMTAALAVTAVAAFYVANTPSLLAMLMSTVMQIVLIIAVFGLVFFLSARIQTLSASAATGFFMLYAGLMGLMLAPIFVVYTASSITQTFIVTAGMFGGMSLYGAVTKRDLSGMGSFLIMGLWGIILASLVNIFFQSSMMSFIISVVGVIVFTGLTAYDTQKIREMAENAPIEDSLAIRRGAILGALTLYLDFVNLFLMLLRLLGNRN